MAAAPDLKSLDLETLILRCRTESRRARSGNPGLERSPCYELFRRAMAGEPQSPRSQSASQTQRAWQALYAQYRRLVLHWIGPHLTDTDSLVNRAFEKFWRYCPRQSFPHRFPDLGHVLAYLKQCAITARQEAQRRYQRETQCEEMAGNPDPEVFSLSSIETLALARVTRQEWWALIERRLKSDAERRLIDLSYNIGLTPLEITARHADEFPSIHEVRRIKERVLKRLRRDTVLQALWEDEG